MYIKYIFLNIYCINNCMINKLLALYQLLSNSLVLLISNQIDKEKLFKTIF